MRAFRARLATARRISLASGDRRIVICLAFISCHGDGWTAVVALVAAYIIAALATPAGISGAFALLPFQVSVLGMPGPVATLTAARSQPFQQAARATAYATNAALAELAHSTFIRILA
jgi:hypothetical protein